MFLGAIPKTKYIKVLQNIEKLYVMEEALHVSSTLTPSQIAVEMLCNIKDCVYKLNGSPTRLCFTQYNN